MDCFALKMSGVPLTLVFRGTFGVLFAFTVPLYSFGQVPTSFNCPLEGDAACLDEHAVVWVFINSIPDQRMSCKVATLFTS